MSTSKHTPGPWLLDMADGTGWICTNGGRSGFEPLAHLSDVSDADARLIAAAPELLEALRAVVAAHTGWEGQFPSYVAAAVAAIAKATE